jgi:hypothetical protein
LHPRGSDIGSQDCVIAVAANATGALLLLSADGAFVPFARSMRRHFLGTAEELSWARWTRGRVGW